MLFVCLNDRFRLVSTQMFYHGGLISYLAHRYKYKNANQGIKLCVHETCFMSKFKLCSCPLKADEARLHFLLFKLGIVNCT